MAASRVVSIDGDSLRAIIPLDDGRHSQDHHNSPGHDLRQSLRPLYDSGIEGLAVLVGDQGLWACISFCESSCSESW